MSNILISEPRAARVDERSTTLRARTAPELRALAPSEPSSRRRLQKAINDGGLHKIRYSWRWASLALGGSIGGAFALNQALSSQPVALGLAAAGLLAVGGAAYAALVEPASPVFERVDLALARLPAELDGLRVIHLSDIHLGTPYSQRCLEQALTIVQRERPELLLFTGDFVSSSESIAELGGLLGGISAPLGCYAVLGNHDYWEGPQEIADQLERAGIELLVNESRTLRWKGASFAIAGVDEPWGGAPDFDATLRDVSPGSFTLLMAHTPLLADEASVRGVDLQLSGHTHGGHVDLPLLGPLALPRNGERYRRGLHQVGATTVYTSRGLGGIPLRLNCPPEVTQITLRRG
jgi:uncharacterized protein